jgi:hypothetical protein
MTWRIAIYTPQTVRGRSVVLESGQDKELWSAKQHDLSTCTAVSCSHPERLALVLAKSDGVRVDGQSVFCPVIAMDTRGGQVSFREPAGIVTVRVAYEGGPSPSRSIKGLCCLCHDPLGNGAPVHCPHCSRVYHHDCLPAIEGPCPACTLPTKGGR